MIGSSFFMKSGHLCLLMDRLAAYIFYCNYWHGWVQICCFAIGSSPHLFSIPHLTFFCLLFHLGFCTILFYLLYWHHSCIVEAAVRLMVCAFNLRFPLNRAQAHIWWEPSPGHLHVPPPAQVLVSHIFILHINTAVILALCSP